MEQTLEIDLPIVMDYLDSLVNDEDFNEALGLLEPKGLGVNVAPVCKLLSFKLKIEKMVNSYNVLKQIQRPI